MVGLPHRIAKTIVSASHALAWISSVIVLGITAYYINSYRHDHHLIFELVIATLFTAFWLPSFILPFLGAYRRWYLPANFIFSYLWLTAFIFAAQDYNRGNCYLNAPRFGRCSLKRANQAFIFLAFIFTIIAMVADALGKRDENRTGAGYEKNVRHSAETGQTGQTTTAPAV